MKVADLKLEKIDYASKDWQKQEKRNFDKLEKSDKEAKKKGILVGRYIRESHADGYALYLIAEESKDTVKIEHITPISDDYVHSYFGYGRVIDRDYVEQSIAGEDKLDEIFGKKEAKNAGNTK